METSTTANTATLNSDVLEMSTYQLRDEREDLMHAYGSLRNLKKVNHDIILKANCAIMNRLRAIEKELDERY
jgi:hypothetical protein